MLNYKSGKILGLAFLISASTPIKTSEPPEQSLKNLIKTLHSILTPPVEEQGEIGSDDVPPPPSGDIPDVSKGPKPLIINPKNPVPNPQPPKKQPQQSGSSLSEQAAQKAKEKQQKLLAKTVDAALKDKLTDSYDSLSKTLFLNEEVAKNFKDATAVKETLEKATKTETIASILKIQIK